MRGVFLSQKQKMSSMMCLNCKLRKYENNKVESSGSCGLRGLLDSDGLGEISWTIDVAAAQNSDVI